jgi:pimeloyl-ACP methyl ester carboxylesterase
MPHLPTPEANAREMLRVLVATIHLRPNEYVPIPPLRIAWQHLGGRVEDLHSAIEYAASRDWIYYNSDKKAHFLSVAGYTAADKTTSSNSEPTNAALRKKVVMLVHGIRDDALWQTTLRSVLEETGFVVEATNYGRMNLFQFLAPFSYFRNKAIATVWNQIRIVKQNNEDSSLSVIAHSFGTFVIAHLLQQEFDIKFDKVIFCGSVVRYGFPFEQFQNRFSQPILNEVGTRDVWPALAESITAGYGSAGTYGFRRPLVRDRWHNQAHHGFFLSAEFCRKFWIPHLNNGVFVPGAEVPEAPRVWLRLLSILKIKWLLTATVIIFLATSPAIRKAVDRLGVNHIEVPDPKSVGTPSDLAAALRKIELQKWTMSRKQIKQLSAGLTATLLPSDSEIPRVTRRFMNEKIVSTLLYLNDRDLSYVWNALPANLDLSYLDLRKVTLLGVHFNGSFLIDTDFTDANLNDVVFEDAWVRNVDFSGARMSNTTFVKTDWFNAQNVTDGRNQGITMILSEWLPCPDEYPRTDHTPFIDLLERWYDVKFGNLNRDEADELTGSWVDYGRAGGLCDMVKKEHSTPR